MTEFRTELLINGHIAVKNIVRLIATKGGKTGDRPPFMSEITIKNDRRHLGVIITSTVLAEKPDQATGLARVFVSRMVDVMSFWLNTPLEVIAYEDQAGNIRPDTQLRTREQSSDTIIEEDRWRTAFAFARRLMLGKFILRDDVKEAAKYYARALAWYRRGLLANDPLDKYLAYWLCLEIPSMHYYNPILVRQLREKEILTPSSRVERAISEILSQFDASQREPIDRFITKLNSRNILPKNTSTIDQVGSCLYELWSKKWLEINEKEKAAEGWIGTNYGIRCDIAHGNITGVGMSDLEKITKNLSKLQNIVRTFLQEWYKEDKLELPEIYRNMDFNRDAAFV